MDYKKKYKEALDRAKNIYGASESKDILSTLTTVFPELRQNEDEKIRKELLESFKYQQRESCTDKEWLNGIKLSEVIAWLEKQGDTNETINRDEFAQGVLRGAAINLITWIDYHAAEGNMCLSNMECKDIEDALVNGNWNKIYAYIRKKLEKQDEQKPTWSEDYIKENIRIIEILIQAISEDITLSTREAFDCLSWLKSLKERMKGE